MSLGDEELEAFKSAVKASLMNVLGESGSKAILFYVGEPNPETFEAKLKAILGEGAAIIMRELKKQEGGLVLHKHHWPGRALPFDFGRGLVLRVTFRPSFLVPLLTLG